MSFHTHTTIHFLTHKTLPVVTQREVRAVDPGEGAEAHCCSGRVGSVVEEIQTEAL